jgi:hypothetical protein
MPAGVLMLYQLRELDRQYFTMTLVYVTVTPIVYTVTSPLQQL